MPVRHLARLLSRDQLAVSVVGVDTAGLCCAWLHWLGVATTTAGGQDAAADNYLARPVLAAVKRLSKRDRLDVRRRRVEPCHKLIRAKLAQRLDLGLQAVPLGLEPISALSQVRH